MKRHLLIVALGASFSMLCLSAQSAAERPVVVDPHVVAVATGGLWESGSRRGQYRVVVANYGYEHVGSRVIAQWISEPTSHDQDVTIHRQKDIVPLSFFSFGLPELQPTANGLRVKLTAVLSIDPGVEVSCLFELKPNGDIKELKPCEPPK